MDRNERGILVGIILATAFYVLALMDLAAKSKIVLGVLAGAIAILLVWAEVWLRPWHASARLIARYRRRFVFIALMGEVLLMPITQALFNRDNGLDYLVIVPVVLAFSYELAHLILLRRLADA